MTRLTQFNPIIDRLPSTIPFVGPEAIERTMNRPFSIRLGANESAFGISPIARQAMIASLDNLSWYGDPEGFELRSALAEHHGVTNKEICLGAGVDELLGLVVRMIIEPGDTVVTSNGAYPTFNYHVAGFGGTLEKVPYDHDHEDPVGLLEAVKRTNARLVYLANPDNPMGTWHSAERLESFIAALPETSTLVLDEAYSEFAPSECSLPIDTSNPRVIRMRTFSKAHGMAGARIGYAIAGAEVVTAFNKIRNHFGISRIALAGALASFRDEPFLTSVIHQVEEGRADYYALANKLGLAYVPSATNFVAIDVGGGDRARALLRALESRGVFVRMPGVAPLDRCVRISVGTKSERVEFAKIFTEVLRLVN